MPKMTAPCRFVCSDCPTSIATKSHDDEARVRAAAFYRETYYPEAFVCEQ